jgi:hypothetical protein
MATPAIIDLEKIVTDYLHGYKKSTEDYFTYLMHACNAYRDFRLFDSHQFETLKITFTVNKWIDMPADMQTFIDICVPINGAWWSFTEHREIVNTTTFTGLPLVEGRDATFEEGVDMYSARTSGYAAAGAVNDFNYMLDWEARRIFINGITSGTGVLFYTSSGIEVTGTTSVPDYITPVIHNYLLWKESYWLPELARERQLREKDYKNSKMEVRNLINAKTYNEWRDIILGSSRQAPSRG